MEGNTKRWLNAIAIIQIPGLKESLHLAFNRAYSRSCVYLARGWYLTGRNAPISKKYWHRKCKYVNYFLNKLMSFIMHMYIKKNYLSLTMFLSVMWLDCFHLMLCNSDLCDNFYYISYPQFCFGKPVKRLPV